MNCTCNIGPDGQVYDVCVIAHKHDCPMYENAVRASSLRKILELLKSRESEWLGGLALVKMSETRYPDPLRRGSIYPHLMVLENFKWVRGRPMRDDKRRMEYQITSEGRACLFRDDL